MKQKDEFMELERYKRACGKILPDPKAVEEVMKIQCTTRKTIWKKAVVLAAACIGIFACSIVGAAAARHFHVEFFVDGKMIQIKGTMEEKNRKYVIHMEEGSKTEREMTMAERLGISVVRHEDQGITGLVLGEEERDITAELKTDGTYETSWEKDGKTYHIQVTDADPEPTVTVTEE